MLLCIVGRADGGAQSVTVSTAAEFATSLGNASPRWQCKHVPCSPGAFAAKTSLAACTSCPRGTYIDTNGASACTSCPPGYYCPPGSSTATPCPGGTFGNGTGFGFRTQCVSVAIGFWAPTGSALPKHCPESGFYCPGADADTETNGAEPLVFEVGTSSETSVETVEETVVEEAVETTMQRTRHRLEAATHTLPPPISLLSSCLLAFFLFPAC